MSNRTALAGGSPAAGDSWSSLIFGGGAMAIITMDKAVELGSLHLAGVGNMMATGGGYNYQFLSDLGSEVRIARFDINPADPHVASRGPHLNLQVFRYDNFGRRIGPPANQHIDIDPLTVRPGDHP